MWISKWSSCHCNQSEARRWKASGLQREKEFIMPVSKELVEELDLYLLSFDRAGYGESDANPKGSVKSEAFGMQELADQWEIGPRFYVIGISMGPDAAWSCLKHIPHRLCGSPNGPPVTATRVRLRDGRHLAYNESGVPKEKAKYKIVLLHGVGGPRENIFPASRELVEELGIYFLTYDRAGYGESDPNPKRSVKSEAFDIQELADQLELGPRFYVIGISMGSYAAWSCLKHIPHRLGGVALIVPIINYWWPSFPVNLCRATYSTLLVQDQWALRIAHYAPHLVYWWATQKWFPTFSALDGSSLCQKDREIIQKISANQPTTTEDDGRQQGDFESMHRDIMVAFSTWDFDPMDLSNAFPHKGSVHIWQGYEDKIVPAILQRYVSKKLPWIQYHELADYGHMLIHVDGMSDEVLRALLGEESSASLADIPE